MNPVSPASLGWLALVLLLAQFLLGIIAARINAAAKSPLRGKVPRNIHVIAGLLLLPLAFIHGWNSMLVKGSANANQWGMWMATFALALMAVQILWGIGLLRQSEATKHWSRKIHLGIGLGILCLTGIHLLLTR